MVEIAAFLVCSYAAWRFMRFCLSATWWVCKTCIAAAECERIERLDRAWSAEEQTFYLKNAD
jgi:hypothetical protein